MSRQPFWPTYSKAPYEIGPGALDARPELALLIGKCIALWSEVELQMALIMAALLKTNTEPAVALYLSLRNARAQKEALRSVAAAVLEEDERLAFAAIFTLCESIEKQRDALAHGVFGVSDDIPDGLIWTTTGAQATFLIRRVGARMAHAAWAADPHTELRQSLFIYRKDDLEDLCRQIESLREILFKFHVYLLDPDLNAGGYLQLCAEPQIAKELARLKAARLQNEQSPPRSLA